MTQNPTTRPGFTLTEVMIALALVTLLLAGISQIFALTSNTISSGQALAKAMRSQKAIQTQLSNDFFGVGNIGDPSFQSGMMPLVNTLDARYASPFLAISNFRVATYVNQAAFAADTVQPADTATMTSPIFLNRSTAIRGTDLNKDGDEADAGEVIPIFQYGERNFRCDTFSMFVRGNFQSQSGTTDFIDRAGSNEAWVWYGHARIFTGNALATYSTNGNGAPGEWLTATAAGFPTPGQNINNRFAEQFRLSRMAGLLIEPTDVKSVNADGSDLTKRSGNGVLADNDYAKPVAFVQRNWWLPAGNTAGGMSPLDFSAAVRKYVPTSSTAGANQTIQVTPPGGSATNATFAMSVSDILGVGIKNLHDRAAQVNFTHNANVPNSGWRRVAPVNNVDRPFVNPFPASITPINLSQRQQLISDNCSQFTVEFAGDFVGQNDTTGAVTGTTPDGILDFAIVNGIRQTRFYGMPRDVDGDGIISAANYGTSPDVVPVRDLAGAGTYLFESRVPPTPTSGNDYASNVAEPAGADDALLSSYVCVWGPNDVAEIPVVTAGVTVMRRAVPQLIRILVDIRDPNGRLKEPVTQEYIFPVRVTAAIEPPKS